MENLTREQAALIGAYTGICFGPFEDIHKIAEEAMGRPIFTHEFGSQSLFNDLKEKLKEKMVALYASRED